MCAIGRALMANPKMVLLDEPSMGLAPQIVEEVFEIVKDLNTKEKVTFLLAEQNTNIALRYADYGYILENGRIVMDGEAKALRENEDVKEFYLGMGGGDRKSFKDVKSYKRRKRWLADGPPPKRLRRSPSRGRPPAAWQSRFRGGCLTTEICVSPAATSFGLCLAALQTRRGVAGLPASAIARNWA
jgi:hypothetical protein